MATIPEHDVPGTIKLQRSPSISNVRLIGQPERVSLVTLIAPHRTHYLLLACCMQSALCYSYLHYASGRRRSE